MATIKQKKAFKEVVNGGSTLSGAMIRAGYSLSTSKRTDKLTNTKGWQELLNEFLPDSILAKKHREGLEATTKRPQIIDRDSRGQPIYEYIKETDYSTRHKYLETAYKLKKRFEVGINVDKAVFVIPSDFIDKHNVRTSPSSETNSPEQ